MCAAAPTSAALIIGRLIAGVGEAGLYVGVLSTVAYAVSIQKRALYLSVVTSLFGVASMAGPILGGVFTDTKSLTWRFCFWINLPIGAIAIGFFGLSFSPKMQPERERPASAIKEIAKLDLGGVLVLLAAFVCLILALQWGGTDRPWSDSTVWGTLLGFGLLIVTFVALQVFKQAKLVVSRFLQWSYLSNQWTRAY